jgi:hypothetical protein
MSKYIPGQGCTCFAWSWVECGCEDVDWTDPEVYELRARVLALEECLYEYVNATLPLWSGSAAIDTVERKAVYLLDDGEKD